MARLDNIPPDLLWQYVEGTLDARQRAFVERFLGQHPEKAQEVEIMRQQQELLETVDDSILSEPVPERLTRVLEAARGRLDKSGGGGGSSGLKSDLRFARSAPDDEEPEEEEED